MLTITERVEKKRLNGYRIPGELYLVGNIPQHQCCKLPHELPFNEPPKRGLQPLPGSLMLQPAVGPAFCSFNPCPAETDSREHFAGMLWISEKYYPGAAHFFQEVRTLPVQVRIKRLHCGIEIGKSWVMLAHRKTIVDYSKGCSGWVGEGGDAETDVQYKPGIFTMFRVDSIEYIMPCPYNLMSPGEQDEVNQLSKAGVTLVSVIKEEDLETGEYNSDDKLLGYE